MTQAPYSSASSSLEDTEELVNQESFERKAGRGTKQASRDLSSMKACMVAYTFYEVDNRVRRYAEALARRGDRVDVIALRQEGQLEREVIDGVRIFRIQRRVLDEKES